MKCSTAVLCVLLTACGKQSICGPSEALVTRVIDGDTIELSDGKRVRYLLVDAPETTGNKNDCFGPEAVEFNRSNVEGRKVTLTYDERECTDRYNRLLAYVRVGDVEMNRALVENGLACTLYIPPAGNDRKEEFETLVSIAKTNRTGLWGACSKVTCE